MSLNVIMSDGCGQKCHEIEILKYMLIVLENNVDCLKQMTDI